MASPKSNNRIKNRNFRGPSAAIGKQSLPADLPFTTATVQEVLDMLKTSERGLSEQEAKRRLEEYGYNEPARKKKRTVFWELISKFANPLVIVLIIIAISSWFFDEKISALLVLFMAIMSVLLSFFQEHRAGREAEKLSEMVRTTATVFRNGRPREIKNREIVPGDIVDLSAGDMIPADLRIISCKDLFLNQASLTGEAFPIEKTSASVIPHNSSLSEYKNIAFMGSSVVSGTGLGVVIKTGLATRFGELSRRVATTRTETSFEKGIREFTWLMIHAMLVLVLVIFGVNAFFKGEVIEALLFSLAVAVGLTPQMLPMLVAINLSKGAIVMARKGVIIKRLNSIQNLGAMDVLCTDKTGTLTLDKVVLEKHCDVIRREDDDVLRLAYVNSFYQTGLKNLLDRAVLRYTKMPVKKFKKVDEIPFDFSRRIMSVVVEMDGHHRIISKGAPEEVFKRCTQYELDGEILEMEELILSDLKEEYHSLSAEGYRVLAVAYKDVPKKESYFREDENELILKGYVAFLDPPKPTAKEAVDAFQRLGIEVKVLTGDNELVTKKICQDVGLDTTHLVTGDFLNNLSDDQMKEVVENTTIFARLSPEQKERVITVLRTSGHTVGYLGDGINDAPALKASDVGISVNNSVDIAKESADLILLKKSLLILEDGVIEGRRTFGNIVKYIKMGSSSNFGNMLSMTGASLLLPFLPMLPIQILLNNFLYDLSQAAIPTDRVDQEYLNHPRPWNVKSIKRFMVFFGPLSSLFDFATFYILLHLFRASQPLFHTGWFLESLCTQTLVVHVIRTEKVPFLESRPSLLLALVSFLIVAAGILIPFSPLAKYFGFVVPPPGYFAILTMILLGYLLMVQSVKKWFVSRYGYA